MLYVDPFELMYWLIVLGGLALVIGIVAINLKRPPRQLVGWWMNAAFES